MVVHRPQHCHAGPGHPQVRLAQQDLEVRWRGHSPSLAHYLEPIKKMVTASLTDVADGAAAGSSGALTASPFDVVRPKRRPHPRADVLLAVFTGGCLGGWARYAITTAWPATGGAFPAATFLVNVGGAFALSVIVVIASDVLPSRYLRPLLGTGFCGGFTTFSSVVVTSDQLFAHRHAATAIAYLAATITAGLAAAGIGLVLARVATSRRRTEGNST
jgi:CrcB protein